MMKARRNSGLICSGVASVARSEILGLDPEHQVADRAPHDKCLEARLLQLADDAACAVADLCPAYRVLVGAVDARLAGRPARHEAREQASDHRGNVGEGRERRGWLAAAPRVPEPHRRLAAQSTGRRSGRDDVRVQHPLAGGHVPAEPDFRRNPRALQPPRFTPELVADHITAFTLAGLEAFNATPARPASSSPTPSPDEGEIRAPRSILEGRLEGLKPLKAGRADACCRLGRVVRRRARRGRSRAVGYSTRGFDRELPSLGQMYRQLHAAPELSGHEEKTGAFVAGELRALGFTVTDHLGKYLDPALAGFGIAGVFKNGDGPTVLVRTELDALPVTEQTGLPYASTRAGHRRRGQRVGVMHACGHDIHMTSFIGTARMLVADEGPVARHAHHAGPARRRARSGAAALLRDHLYERVRPSRTTCWPS